MYFLRIDLKNIYFSYIYISRHIKKDISRRQEKPPIRGHITKDRFLINFRSAKSQSKIRHLSAKGGQPAILREGRRVGRGPSEALESAEIGRSIRHASGTPLCETGAADL